MWRRSARGPWTRARGDITGEEFAELLETEGAGFGVDVSLSGCPGRSRRPGVAPGSRSRSVRRGGDRAGARRRDVDRHVQLRLAEIEQAQANSAQTASIAFRAAVFDAGTRASRMSGGEPETVGQGDARCRCARFMLIISDQRGATLVLAGDFSDDPIAAAERCLGCWRNADQQQVEHPSNPPRAGGVRC